MPRLTSVHWATIVLAVIAVLLASPVLADTKTVHIQDEDVLLVGDPTDSAHFEVGLGLVHLSGVATEKTYTFEVRSPDNRLEIDLEYDQGPTLTPGPCLRVTDLDLYVTGPDGFQIDRTHCDRGQITILGDDVPTGSYEVQVDADHGATACLPSGNADCDATRPAYRFEAVVWDLQG